jgi:ferredoxin
MLYIDPRSCIDCEACLPECPVEAIYADVNVPTQWKHYIALNEDRSAALAATGDAAVTERQEPKEGPACTGRK